IANGGGIILDGVDDNGKQNTVRTRMDDYTHALGSLKAPNALHIYDASYIKLRELSLSYSFSGKDLGTNIIKDLSLALTSSNLWIISKKSPYSDPEAGLSSGNIQGYQSGILPTTRNIGFNVKIQF